MLDPYRGHLTDNVKATLVKANMDLAVIRGGMKDQLQPLDVCVNKPFKDRVWGFYMDWLNGEKHQLTATGRIKHTITVAGGGLGSYSVG